jgi:hypothetical protein
MTRATELSERSMVEYAYSRLVELDDVTVNLEVPLGGRFVDLVYVRHGRVCTVEFKLASWRRALEQAVDHLLGADSAYVCMPKRPVPQEMRNAFHEAGVGLLFFTSEGDWPFELVIEGHSKHGPWEVARQQLLNVAQCSVGEGLDVYV